jgi:hypothetical protein
MQINPILISKDEGGENGHIQILYVASPSYVQRGIYKYYMLFFLTYAHQSAIDCSTAEDEETICRLVIDES